MVVIAMIIAVIVGFAYFVAWTFVWWLAIDEERPIAAIVLAVVLVALLLLGIDLIAEDPDNSVHCGSGTTYRESSRHDWVCEAN